MPIGDQDQGGITLAITATLGDSDQLVDLGGRQVFPRSQLGVGPPDRNCPIFVAWREPPASAVSRAFLRRLRLQHTGHGTFFGQSVKPFQPPVWSLEHMPRTDADDQRGVFRGCKVIFERTRAVAVQQECSA